jgi:hypothetical protein
MTAPVRPWSLPGPAPRERTGPEVSVGSEQRQDIRTGEVSAPSDGNESNQETPMIVVESSGFMRRSLNVTADRLGFGAPKNKASHRSLPLNKTAIAALRAHHRNGRSRLASDRS